MMDDTSLDLEMITDAIEAGRPLAEILDLVVERAHVILGACETLILLYEDDVLVGSAGRGLSVADPSAIRLHLNQSIEGWVAVHRRPLIIPDPHADHRFEELPGWQRAIRSIIALPLQAGGRMLGVLSAATSERSDFSDDLLLLLVLADLATLAIETRRYTEREVRRARLMDLLRFVSAADYTGELPTALGPVTDRIAEVMRADKVDLFFYDAPRDILISLGVSRTPLGERQKALGLDILPMSVGSLARFVFTEGKSLLVTDAQRDPREYRPVVEDLGIRAELLSPVENKGERVGVLISSSSQPDAFRAEDLAVQDLVARRLSLALQHQQMTEDLDRLEAERLERLERDDFLELLAHDLKNPLSVIKGYTQLARRRLRSGDVAYVDQALVQLNEKSDQLNRLMNDMLEVIRMASGTFTVVRTEIDLAALVRTEVEAAQSTTTAHTISADCPATCHVLGDQGRLAEVFQNLLTNAIRYSPGGGRIIVTVGEADGQAEVCICDQGLGIRPEDLPHIFDRSFRGRGQKLGEGRGLGLYISREIVRLHAGRVWVESNAGQGSCFHVAIPSIQAS